MQGRDPRRRRESFDTIADLYERYRPGYPAEVVADIVASAGIRDGSRVLEIGCGTGQLSLPLAQRGADLTAVELGPGLAAIARRKLAGLANARVEVAAFEEWPLPEEPFDAVVCANAFHWLAPELRLSKSARALRPAATLLVVHPHHVGGEDPAFYGETNKVYAKWGLSDDPSWRPPAADEAPAMYPEIEEQDEFASVTRHRFTATRRFTTESYVGMLQTDSLILGLEEEARRGFLRDITRLIDAERGGEVRWDYVYEVIAARKRH